MTSFPAAKALAWHFCSRRMRRAPSIRRMEGMVRAIADTTRTTTIITLHRSKALFKAMAAGFHRTATTLNFPNRTAATTATRKPGFPKFLRTIRTTITADRVIRITVGTLGTTCLGTIKKLVIWNRGSVDCWHPKSTQLSSGFVTNGSPINIAVVPRIRYD